MRHYWPFPLPPLPFAFTLAGLGKGTVLASRAREGCRRRCRRRLLLCCCCGRLEVVKGKTFTTALALAALALALLVLGPPARRTVVSVSRIDLSPEELDLLAGLHRRSSLDLSKEASIRLLRYLHLSGLLEEITTRLDDVLAKELEQHSAQVFR